MAESRFQLYFMIMYAGLHLITDVMLLQASVRWTVKKFVYIFNFSCIFWMFLKTIFIFRKRCLHFLNEANIKKIRMCTTKPTKWLVRLAKTQISMGIRPILSESSPCAHWVAKDQRFLQCAQRRLWSDWPSLIGVFAGHTGYFVGFVMRRLKYIR